MISSNFQKMTKLNLRNKVQRHAHLQTLKKIPAEFQTDSTKIVGGVVFTKYPVLVEVEPKMTKFKLPKK